MKIKRAWVAAVATCTVLGVSGCGAADGGSGGSGDGLTPEAQAAVDAALEGTNGQPPSDAPVPEPGKNIWLVTASAQLTDFGAPGQIKDAAEQIGWDLTVFDGQFNTDTMVSGLRQAIADQADGVIVFNIDCVAAKAGYQDLNDAGIPVVGFESIDCNQAVEEDGSIVDTGERGVFDAVSTYDNPDDPETPLTFVEFWSQVAVPFQALGIIDATDGAAKIIKVRQVDFPITLSGDDDFDATIDEYCPDCEVVETVEITGADFGPAVQDKVAQALARHPDANAVYGIYDAVALGLAPAVVATGRADDIFVMAAEGTEPVIELIRAGRGIDAGTGYSVRWEAYAALDAMVRLLGGETPEGAGFPSGMGVQLFNKDHNLPAEGERFEGPVDFQAAYFDAWGVE